MEALKQRASTLVELKEAARFYLEAPASYDEKAKATLEKGKANLPLLVEALEAHEAWNAEALKARITALAEAHGKKLGELMPVLRASIVGAMSGPDIPDAMAFLGKNEILGRLKAALSLA